MQLMLINAGDCGISPDHICEWSTTQPQKHEKQMTEDMTFPKKNLPMIEAEIRDGPHVSIL